MADTTTTIIDDEVESLGAMLFGRERDPAIRSRFSLTESSTGRTVSYDQLARDAHSVAKAMVETLNHGPDQMVAIMSDSSIHFAVCLSACVWLNVPFTLAGPASGTYDLAFRLRQTEARCLFVSRELLQQTQQMFENAKYADLRQQVQVVLIDNHLAVDAEEQVPKDFLQIESLIEMFPGDPDPDHPVPYFQKTIDSVMGIFFTSGSTGLPKGACHTHRSFMTNCRELAELPALRPHRHRPVLMSFPLCHVSGSILFFMTIWIGTPVVLIKYQDIDAMTQMVRRYQIGQIFCPSNATNRLVKTGPGAQIEDLSPLKLVFTAGCKLSEKTSDILVNQCGIQLVDSYGSTETLFVSASDGTGIPTDVGPVMPSFQVKVIDLVTGEPLPEDDSGALRGEICLRGVCLFRGYFRNQEETARAFDTDGWYRMGDIGHLDRAGRLHITDRLKEIIKFDQWTLFPAEMECFLIGHDSVRAAVVVPVKHATFGQVPRAYVELEPEATPITVEDLEKYVNDNLGYQQQLRGGIIIMDQLRYNAMGKVDRQHFKQLSAQQMLTG